MDAFDAHANMQNPDIARHLMAWTSLYDPSSPMTGEVWSADGAKVNEKTSGFGAKFEFYDYPVIGKVDLMRGDSGPAGMCAIALHALLQAYPDCMHMCMHTHARASTNASLHRQMHAHACAHACNPALAHLHLHARMHTCTHAHARLS